MRSLSRALAVLSEGVGSTVELVAYYYRKICGNCYSAMLRLDQIQDEFDLIGIHSLSKLRTSRLVSVCTVGSLVSLERVRERET